MNPRVSIIIATYNFGRFLAETLENVFRQTLQDWELVIVDDGSTDNTREIVNRYLSDKRVRYVFQRNRGLASARNTGIRASSGEYVQFLDADDLIHTKKLEMQSRYFDHQKDVDVVFSDYGFFKDGDPETVIQPPFQKSTGDIKLDMLRGNFIAVNSPLSRRKSIDSVGGFDEALTSTEDWDLWLRMLLSGKVFDRFGERLAFVRLHPRRMTGNRLNMYSGRYQVLKKNLTDVRKDSIYWRSAKRCFVRSKLAVMRESLYQGRFNEILRVILEKPHHVSIWGIIDFIMETLIIAKRTS
jgi:glycosyltransferase involved in cell wall biosynthesis